METQKTEAKKFVLNYGVLLGILSVLMGVIMYVTNAYLNPSWIFGTISFLITVVVISLAIRAYKTENEGFLGLGEALKVGIGVAVIGGIIGAIWMFLLMNYIEPEYASQLAEVQREAIMETNPNMTEAQLETAMEFNAKFSSPYLLLAFSLIGSLFMGLVISLIAGLIMKNKNPYQA